MEINYKKGKKSSILTKLERYLSMSRRVNSPTNMFNKCSKAKKQQVAPTGCFSVYVGAEKQRFVIKTEFANHPLFKMLLEDAELEYGFKNDGPLHLPCQADLFCRVLAEMDCGEFDGFSNGTCSPFNPRAAALTAFSRHHTFSRLITFKPTHQPRN